MSYIEVRYCTVLCVAIANNTSNCFLSDMRFHNQSLIQGCIVVVLSYILCFFPSLRSLLVSSSWRRVSLHCECFYILSMHCPAAEFGTQIGRWNIHVYLLPFMTVFPSDSALCNVFACAGSRNCTGLFKMIVEVLTTCHTQYTWDRSICFFFFI